jgi:hypothetical protein
MLEDSAIMAATAAERWPSAIVPVGSSNPPPGMPITWVRFHALTVWTFEVCARDRQREQTQSYECVSHSAMILY